MQREPLRGWQATARLMAADWNGGTIHSGRSAAGLRDFLRKLAGTEAVIYLAAHHEPEGVLDLPQDGRVRWGEVWPGEGTGRWTVVLDMCHAEASLVHLPPSACWVTTSASQEKAWELRLFSPRTSPLGPSQGATLEALRGRLGPNWDGRISAWGLGWVLSSPSDGVRGPQTPEQWRDRVRRSGEAISTLEVRRPLIFRSTWQTHFIPLHHGR